ncbi:MAG: hypothetical protein WAS23_04995, partial [Dokdonella sp.]
MRSRWFSLLLAASFLPGSSQARAADDQPRYGMFGQLHVQRPVAGVADTVLLLSDRGGWSAHEDALARA